MTPSPGERHQTLEICDIVFPSNRSSSMPPLGMTRHLTISPPSIAWPSSAFFHCSFYSSTSTVYDGKEHRFHLNRENTGGLLLFWSETPIEWSKSPSHIVQFA